MVIFEKIQILSIIALFATQNPSKFYVWVIANQKKVLKIVK